MEGWQVGRQRRAARATAHKSPQQPVCVLPTPSDLCCRGRPATHIGGRCAPALLLPHTSHSTGCLEDSSPLCLFPSCAGVGAGMDARFPHRIGSSQLERNSTSSNPCRE